MVDTHEQQNGRPDQPAAPSRHTQNDEHNHNDSGHNLLPGSENGIGHMTPVQLADRKQIQACDQQADPPGKSDGMQDQIDLIRQITMDDPADQGKKQGTAETHSRFRHVRSDFRKH